MATQSACAEGAGKKAGKHGGKIQVVGSTDPTFAGRFFGRGRFVSMGVGSWTQIRPFGQSHFIEPRACNIWQESGALIAFFVDWPWRLTVIAI